MKAATATTTAFLILAASFLTPAGVSGQGTAKPMLHIYEHYNAENRGKAMEYAELYLESPEAAMAGGDTIAALSDELADYYENSLFKYSKAAHYLEKSLTIYRTQDKASKAAHCEFKIGQMNYYLGQYDKTLDFASRAYGYYRKQGDTTGMMDCLNLIGIVNLSCNEFDTAARYFDECMEMAAANKDSVRFVRVLNNIATYKGNILMDTTGARALLRASADICIKIGDTADLFTVYANLASSYLKSSQNAEAAATLPLLREMATDIRTKGFYHYLAGGCRYYAGEYDKATEEFILAIDNFSQGDFPEKMMSCLNILAETYYRTGRTDKAFETLREYQVLKDEFINPKVYLNVFNKQKQIQEEQLRTAHLQKMNSVLTVTIISALIMIAATLLMYYKYRRKMKDVRGRESEIRSKKEILELDMTQAYRRDKIIGDAIGKLRKIIAAEEDGARKNELTEITAELSKSAEEPEEWKEIRKFVPDFNGENFQKLIRDHPDLSINERRLCAFLNKNMTTKEISAITHQSVHSITVARARLRHKLGLTGSPVSIQEFLSKYN